MSAAGPNAGDGATTAQALDAMLLAAGRVAMAGRALAGGCDFTTGRMLAGASLYTASERAEGLRAALDAYDDAVLAYTRATQGAR